MDTLTLFTFDGDYDNQEQVRPFMDGYRAARATFTDDPEGIVYNDSLRGMVPGLAGSPSEDTGIYLCQNLHRVDALRERVERFLSNGGRIVTEGDDTRMLRGTVVHFGYHMGGTGWTQWDGARLLFRNGKPYAVLPKGKRTHGHFLSGGSVLFREAV